MKAVTGHRHPVSRGEIEKSEKSADPDQMTARLSDPLGRLGTSIKNIYYLIKVSNTKIT